jgi:DNA (cytosine-5)-methyltransferase 1
VNVVSLFSGVGGFDLGFEQAGFTTVYQCEWDKHATNILNRHWPEVPKWGDVQTLTGAEILRHCQTPDVIIWGSPCQDLSVAGKRAGLDGERSGLFHEGIRIINELREATDGRYPRVSVWENVAGALNSNRGADFGTVLNEMAEAGALVIEWALLDAQHFGVPQRRRRVFVVAIFDPATAERCPDPLLPVGESVRGDSQAGKQKGQAVAATVGACVDGGGSGGVPSGRGDGTDNLIAATFGNGSFAGWSESDVAVSLSAREYKSGTTVAVEPFTKTSNTDFGYGVGTLRSSGGDAGGGSETLLVEPFVKVVRSGARDENGDLPPEVWRSEQVNPTLNQFDMGDTRANAVIVQPIGFSHTQGLSAQPSEQAWPTLRTEGNGMAVMSQMAVRRLTPLECERLMGWPDNWTDGQADSHRYRQCGNGVATPVAHWIASHLRPIL